MTVKKYITTRNVLIVNIILMLLFVFPCSLSSNESTKFVPFDGGALEEASTFDMITVILGVYEPPSNVWETRFITGFLNGLLHGGKDLILSNNIISLTYARMKESIHLLKSDDMFEENERIRKEKIRILANLPLILINYINENAKYYYSLDEGDQGQFFGHISARLFVKVLSNLAGGYASVKGLQTVLRSVNMPRIFREAEKVLSAGKVSKAKAIVLKIENNVPALQATTGNVAVELFDDSISVSSTVFSVAPDTSWQVTSSVDMATQAVERLEYLSRAEKDQQAFETSITKYFSDLNGLRFIQIGANDGVMHDPIHSFITKNNWKGLLIEPQKKIFENLLKTYEGNKLLSFENVAIADKEGTTTLYKLDEDYIKSRGEMGSTFEELTGIASMNLEGSELSNTWVDQRYIITEEVPTTTFKNILAKHQISVVDLLQIDTEGYDAEIIKQIDFNILKPKVIHFEHSFLSQDGKLEIQKVLVNAGYKVVFLEYNTVATLR